MRPTLVLPPRYTQDSIALWKAATAANWKVERLSSWRVPDWLKDEAEVVFYGEPLLAAAVSSSTNLELSEPEIDWLPRLPEHYRKREVRVADLAEARTLRSLRFIKPAQDKCFAAKVYASGEELPSDDLLPATTSVLISDPVRWLVEFRCFVLEREVLTMSPYLRNGDLVQAEDERWASYAEDLAAAAEFAALVLSDQSVPFPPAVVLDVGFIHERGWAVVETNAAWGSGIYGCDPRAVLQVIRGACTRRPE